MLRPMPQAPAKLNDTGIRMSVMRRRTTVLTACLVFLALPVAVSSAPQITKSYSYFSISGRTAEDLDAGLSQHGPLTGGTGFRHPGATEIRFGGDITYHESEGRCSIGDVNVTLATRIILPRWKNRKRADGSLALIWDTLSADIKRHEERHAEIARQHARTLEQALRALPATRSCALLEKQVGDTSRRIIDAHDADQLRFDMVEAKNFEARMMRLLRHRTGSSE
jgi:predicted secreted Zn-dependent protease